MPSKTTIALLLLIIGLLACLFWQWTTHQRLTSAHSVLQSELAQLESLKEENARLLQAQVPPAELQRLRAEQSELLRLRGEVAQLRQQLKALPAKAPASTNRYSSAQSESPNLPFQTYHSTNFATLAWNHSLVTGGWEINPGKRTLVFIQPLRVENSSPGQLLLQGKIIEVPEEFLGSIGLQDLRSPNTQSTAQALLTPEQFSAVIKLAEQTSGVDVLSAPRVITTSGTQAAISIGQSMQTTSGDTYQLGPTINILPQTSPDASSVSLSIATELRVQK